MKEISIINIITVPEGMEVTAIEMRELYVDYFRKQEGFVSSTFYRSVNENHKEKYINIVVWDSYDSYKNIVNTGFSNLEGKNTDGMKVLGRGFPEPIEVSPSQYEIIGI
jgi:heme-degrading monooxygenase HmoA